MAEPERAVLEFYGVTTAYPSEWPAEKDEAGASDEEDSRSKPDQRKSRFRALERAVSQRRGSVVPGSDTSGGGLGSLLQRDEPDPLGTTDSVVRTLKQMGLPLQDDPQLRNRFLLSSTSFSPALFISQMHAGADTRSLLTGLDVLSKSIDQKSASLKVLVESNFERFVRAKATIDNVYKEMKYRGEDPTTARPKSGSRHTSRNSIRGAAVGSAAVPGPLASAIDGRKKNALVKESEYGVMGIKAPLLEVAAKAEDVWGPALHGREKEEDLKRVASSLSRFKTYIEASANIADSIKRKDHESLVEEYAKARRFADEARELAQAIGSSRPAEAQLCQILLAARMWHDVDEQIQAFKRDVWRKLISLHKASKGEPGPSHSEDQHMDLIALLLELGVEDNPIWVWLLSQYDYLKGKIQSGADRFKVEIEVLRRRLANADKPPPQAIASHLRSLGGHSIENKSATFDSADVVELWEKIVSFLTSLLSSQGVLGEVVEFWQTAMGFIEGKTQRALPVGYNGESRGHHRLSEQGAADLRKATVELVDMIREQVLVFLAGPPPDDMSLFVSPLPQSPNTPLLSPTPGSMTPGTIRDPRFAFDALNLPPPSPKRGEPWEKFAFWPPWSNSVSGVYYLSKVLALVGAGASDMAGLAPVAQNGSAQVERLRTLVGAARERCVTALCAAWNRDAENIKFVEDWNRAPDRRDVTKMPASFSAFEGALLGGMQKILYISEAMSKPGAGDIVLPPSTKLLQMVRSQYVTTLYKALSGMVENAERSLKRADEGWAADADDYLICNDPKDGRASLVGGGVVDAGDRNFRMLLTLSNLQFLRAEVVPSLNTQFENAFSVKLTDETKTIRDVLGQIDARLFQSYTRPAIEKLHTVIHAGVASPDWAPAAGEKPREVKPYIYEALLGLVLVHSQVSTTATSLTNQVLSYLLEQASRELLDALKARPRYPLEALMQATLDVEFVAQTLTQYTTDRASELQGLIYQELDARTDNDARAGLQAQLPEMRSVLKRLREASKSEFACFRKPKKPHAGAGSGSAPPLGPLERTGTGLSDRSDR